MKRGQMLKRRKRFRFRRNQSLVIVAAATASIMRLGCLLRGARRIQ
ncbi:unnamed protein product [Arabidopsis halleri]